MLTNGEAGIDCINCGHQEIAKTRDECDLLEIKLEWNDFGDPFCPVCGDTVMFEEYLDLD
jgi:ribosomal protein S27AE|tara:strand:- start:266 stop:445 length:180 start_codon:yes stop_codon:yes gene_type:complete